MNNKGFTLIELLATIVVLTIVAGIVFAVINVDFGRAKEKSEEVFVDTIKDAIKIYLDTDAKKLDGYTLLKEEDGNNCVIKKRNGNVSVYRMVIDMKDIIDSSYTPITQNDLVNPANKDVKCANADDITVSIYRDDDYVYYYSVSKSDFNCLKNIGGDYKTVISNLPEGYSCS